MNAKGEEVLRGAIVPLLTVTRAATVPDAIKGFEISRRAVPGAETVLGVGSEAWIAPLPPESSEGEIAEGATAGVREHNVNVAFAIVGIPADASRTAVLALLSAVAAKL
jgi:hypothetical protein